MPKIKTYVDYVPNYLQCGHITVDPNKLSDENYRRALEIGVTELIARGDIDPLQVKATKPIKLVMPKAETGT